MARSYLLHSAFYTLQGEGRWTGHAAVFLRFAGCNAWTGREEDRAADSLRANCAAWCDTSFRDPDPALHGGRYDALALASLAASLAPGCAHNAPDARAAPGGGPGPSLRATGQPGAPARVVVLTGGEPSLQLDVPLLDALHAQGFRVHVETNGSRALPPGIDWLTVSPKPPLPVIPAAYDECKVVLPSQADPEVFRYLAPLLWVQPLAASDGSLLPESARLAADYVLSHPWARLSIQTHKLLGLP